MNKKIDNRSVKTILKIVIVVLIVLILVVILFFPMKRFIFVGKLLTNDAVEGYCKDKILKELGEDHFNDGLGQGDLSLGWRKTFHCVNDIESKFPILNFD